MQDYHPELDRPIWGAKNIGEAIDRTERQAFYLLEQGHIDASKVGGVWCSSKRRLLFGGSKSTEQKAGA